MLGLERWSRVSVHVWLSLRVRSQPGSASATTSTPALTASTSMVNCATRTTLEGPSEVYTELEGISLQVKSR